MGLRVDTGIRRCEDCGADYSRKPRIAISEFMNSRFCSRACRNKHTGSFFPPYAHPILPTHPCRFCEGPTRYNKRHLTGKACCDKPECRESARILQQSHARDTLQLRARMGFRDRWFDALPKNATST